MSQQQLVKITDRDEDANYNKKSDLSKPLKINISPIRKVSNAEYIRQRLNISPVVQRQLNNNEDLPASPYIEKEKEKEKEVEKIEKPKTSSLKDFEIVSKLGDGAYSRVYKVKRLADGQLYALKKAKLGSMTYKDKENAINEVRIIANINHPNVISYKEAFVDNESESLW